MKTGKPYQSKIKLFFHKLLIDPYNSLIVKRFNRKPSSDQIRTSDNGFVAWEHLDKDELDYDLNLAVKIDFVIYHNYSTPCPQNNSRLPLDQILSPPRPNRSE